MGQMATTTGDLQLQKDALPSPIIRKVFAVLLVTTLRADILLAFTESITVFKLPLLIEYPFPTR
uniref:Uncharacterized protein n=1 Tax=Peronospora matthiolae TaxID=2874970 RepID=A0AAV1UHB0_9STRA